MADILPFTRRGTLDKGIALIEKIVDGEIIECVNVDALTPAQKDEFFQLGRLAEKRPASPWPPLSR
ncbi:hypothetical protein [Rhizobium laguerreae]|uniref:hypothetical protein n=1 Tax=Rhizobium laguerreae TaxID=1076926 RepID=UPI001C90EB39|nr:hypothetical protein [Rhizobium laguerreae]MBY3500177.1 hypothetical protein [Rhizobium laguerreae]